MSNDDLMLDVGLANEIKLAARRAGASGKDLKELATGDRLAQILPFLRGEAEIVIKKYVIDLDAVPFCPEGWEVEEHRKGGLVEYTPEMVSLWLSEHQKNGGCIQGHKLKKELESLPVMNANMLDWYLAHLDKIPEEWKNRGWVYFWGTTYRHSGGSLIVRCLNWSDDHWYWAFRCLDGDFGGSYPAAVSASQP